MSPSRITVRRALRPFGTAAGGLLLASRLAAQTLPVPALPPEPALEPERSQAGRPGDGPPADTVDASAPARARPWEYALGAGVGWDSNVGFLVPDGPQGVALVPRGGIARVWSGRRAQLRATAAGGWTGYPEEKELNRYQADGALDGTYRPSASTTWRATASQGFGYSDSSRILLEQGVSLPVVKTRSLAAALGLRRAGARKALRVDARYYQTAFDSPDLIDGASVRGTLGLERQLSSRTTTAVEYSVENVLSDSEGRSYLTHFGSLQWTRILSPRSALLLEAGASYTPDAARAQLDRKEGFFGGASFSRQLRRSTVMLFVRREVTPAFGLGVSRLELRSGLSATIPVGRAWDLRMFASHVRPDTPRDLERAYPPSADAFAAVARRLGRHLELSAEARYRQRGATAALPRIEAFQGGLFLTLLTPSGRAIAPAPGR